MGDLKTLVFKYETSNIISQSDSLPVVFILMPVFVGRNRENTFVSKNFKVYKILNFVSLEKKTSIVHLDLVIFTLELFSSIKKINSFYNPLNTFLLYIYH